MRLLKAARAFTDALLEGRARGGRKQSQSQRPSRRRPAPGWVRPAIRIGSIAGALLFAAFATGWLAYWGWFDYQAERARVLAVGLTADAGLKVQEVVVQGRRHTPPRDLLAAMRVDRGDPIVAFDPAEARARVEALPWIKSAVVERAFPDTIRITLVERKPLALWQDEGTLRLIDTDGEIIGIKDLRPFRDLPILVGEGVAPNASALIRLIDEEPVLAGRVTAAVRVSDRRWNVRIEDRVNVKLPAEGAEDAWRRLARIEQEHGILQRDIVAVDLRYEDRVIVRLAPGAEDRLQVPEKATWNVAAASVRRA